MLLLFGWKTDPWYLLLGRPQGHLWLPTQSVPVDEPCLRYGMEGTSGVTYGLDRQ